MVQVKTVSFVGKGDHSVVAMSSFCIIEDFLRVDKILFVPMRVSMAVQPPIMLLVSCWLFSILVTMGAKVNDCCHPSIWPLPLPPANPTSVTPVAEHVCKTLVGPVFVERGHLICQVVAKVSHFRGRHRKFLGLRPGPGKFAFSIVV